MRSSPIAICMLGVILSSLPGCAVVSDYWRKPTKYKQMPDRQGWAPPVATLSLDASRRLVISQQLYQADDPRFTCPEPPPDVALNTLSQTLASLRSRGGDSAEFAQAYEAVAQAIHARTSTVEMWRTTSSMFCVLLMNDRTTEAYAYLDAAKDAIAKTEDKTVTVPASQMLVGIFESAFKAKQEAEAKAAEAKAAEEKRKAAEAAELEKAKQECAKVAEDKKANDENCKKVKAAEAKTSASG